MRVKRIRCAVCKTSVKVIYPPGVQRSRWYHDSVQGIFAVLDVHQVKQACKAEIAAVLGHPIVPDTQDAWEDTHAFRARQHHQQEVSAAQQQKLTIPVGSIDEIRVGNLWVYTLTETHSQAVISVKFSEQREETAVRDLVAEYPPELVISDGCTAIEAGMTWFGDIPHARCWFHIQQALYQLASRTLRLFTLPTGQVLEVEERQKLMWDVQFLYQCGSLEEAVRFLGHLQEQYAAAVLAPLVNAWEGLKLRWLHQALPLTNNTSETLYNGIWPRERKRVAFAAERVKSWMYTALFRWNHHVIRQKTPWERFSKRPPVAWLARLLTPLAYPPYHSTVF